MAIEHWSIQFHAWQLGTFIRLASSTSIHSGRPDQLELRSFRDSDAFNSCKQLTEWKDN